MRAEQQLRPLNLGEILDVGIKIYMRNALTLFKIVAVVVVPVQFLSVIITLSALPDFFSAFSGTPPDPDETETFAEDPSQLWTLFADVGLLRGQRFQDRRSGARPAGANGAGDV
jgi:hypothetical protein